MQPYPPVQVCAEHVGFFTVPRWQSEHMTHFHREVPDVATRFLGLASNHFSDEFLYLRHDVYFSKSELFFENLVFQIPNVLVLGLDWDVGVAPATWSGYAGLPASGGDGQETTLGLDSEAKLTRAAFTVAHLLCFTGKASCIAASPGNIIWSGLRLAISPCLFDPRHRMYNSIPKPPAPMWVIPLEL